MTPDTWASVYARTYVQKMEYIKSGGDPDQIGGFGKIFRGCLDAMGLEEGRQYITSAVRIMTMYMCTRVKTKFTDQTIHDLDLSRQIDQISI